MSCPTPILVLVSQFMSTSKNNISFRLSRWGVKVNVSHNIRKFYDKKRGKVINNEFYALITPKNNLLIKRVLFLLLTFYDNKVSYNFERRISACTFYLNRIAAMMVRIKYPQLLSIQIKISKLTRSSSKSSVLWVRR